ncbi:hypothetical protein T12_4740, partial [Trichinella patagoniensis]
LNIRFQHELFLSSTNNFPQARRRLLAVERRLARCEEEKREYAATMRQYVCICSIQLCSGQLNFTNGSLALSQAY